MRNELQNNVQEIVPNTVLPADVQVWSEGRIRLMPSFLWACKQALKPDGVDVQVLSEGRIRLVSGLKRYFHSKRGRGLISAEGVQLLDHACSAAVDDPKQRLNIWQNIEK